MAELPWTSGGGRAARLYIPNHPGADMDLIEISDKHNLSREGAAALLHEIADSLARHNELEFERNGIKLRVDVADRVEVEIELEIESDESSLEIEITW